MYEIHFLHPEQRWGVFHDGVFVRSFDSYEAAEMWIAQKGLDKE